MAQIKNYITLSDVISLQDDIEKFFQGETNNNNNNNNCQLLIQFCQRFKNILKKYQIQEINNKLIYNTKANDIKMAVRQIMVVGAQFIFKLRTFLLDEEITFIIGGEDPKNKNLKTIEREQSEILNSLISDLSDGAVQLSSSLENVNKMNPVSSRVNNLWKQIKKFSSVENIYKEGQSADKEVDDRKYYQKREKDIDVYLRFGNKNGVSVPYKYYGNNLKFFNNGWLFEWFQTLITNNSNMEIILDNWFKNSMTPLSPIILGMDNIPGYKGGDFSAGTKLYQAKFQNQRLITFNAILELINQILSILQLYQIASNNDKQQRAAELLNLFIDSNSSTINESYDIIIDELLKTTGKLS